MGMFDYIQCDSIHCPLCGNGMAWQSKDGECLFRTVTVHELMDKSNAPTIYGSCNDCRVWIEVSVRRQFGRTAAQWTQFRRERAIIEAAVAEDD